MTIKLFLDGYLNTLSDKEVIASIERWIEKIRQEIAKEQIKLLNQSLVVEEVNGNQFLRRNCIFRHPPFQVLDSNSKYIRENCDPILDYEDCQLIIKIVIGEGIYVTYNTAMMKINE